MPRSNAGFMLMIAGIVLVVIGALVWLGWLSWFGRLPGDVRIERPGVRVYIPITTMILLSIVLSLLAAILRRFR
jgi:membrane protein implicated in regulation of membrane protease activity